VQQILMLLARHGAGVVFVTAFLEQIGAPVPAIPVFIVAGGVSAAAGHSILWLFFLAMAGALIADSLWFFLGRHYGYRVLGLLCRISLSPDSCVRRTETFFEKWGFQSLLVAKFIPGFSIVAPPMAGTIRTSGYLRFILWDGAGAAIWAGSSLAIGIIFHDAIDRTLNALAELGAQAVVLIASMLALYVLFKWWERRRFFQFLRMARITPEALRERMANGPAVVVLDVRSAAAQAADPSRIPGALTLDPDDLETRLMDVATHDEIVLYCT
jgi:membrane protein DedA with SNARE-associated domain